MEFRWIFNGFQWILNGVVIVFWRFLAAPGVPPSLNERSARAKRARGATRRVPSWSLVSSCLFRLVVSSFRLVSSRLASARPVSPRLVAFANFNALPVLCWLRFMFHSFLGSFFRCFFCMVFAHFLGGFGAILGVIFDQVSLLFLIKKVVYFSIDFSSIFGWIWGA